MLAGYADRILEIVATGVPSETFKDKTSYTIDRKELLKMAR